MKNIFILLFIISFTSKAQQATTINGTIPIKKTISFYALQLQDFGVEILNRTQNPIPSAEYGDKKRALDIRRTELEKSPFPKLKKTRATATNPQLAKGWLANTSSSTPLDNDIAVSNDGKVVSVVNSNMRVYDDTGKLLGTLSLTNMVASLGSYTWISDPRVLYDGEQDRFVLVCFSGDVSFESKIFVGFSKTNDPLGVWNFYALNGNSFNDSTWSDYPIISLNKDDLFMTFNQVKDSVSWTVGFKQSVIWQIDKQKGYNGDSLQYTLWSNLQENGKFFRNICPAKQQAFPYTNEQYFLSVRNVDSSNDSVFLFKINNSQQSGLATLAHQTLISNTAYGFPPNAKQRIISTQQYLMTNDARILAAIYENDRIYFGSNTVNPLYINAAVYLGTITNLSSNPTVTASIVSNDTTEFAYPSMTYMGLSPTDHKILFSFSHCRKNGYPGNSILYLDNQSNFSDIISTKEGSYTINILTDSIERWGDYSGIQHKYNTNNRAYMANSCGIGGSNRAFVGIIDNLDIPTSVSNTISNVSDVTLFPNPTFEKLFVHFTTTKKQKMHFDILNLNGQVVQVLIHDNVKKGENQFSFNTTPLPKGVYILSIYTDSEKYIYKKFEVQ